MKKTINAVEIASELAEIALDKIAILTDKNFYDWDEENEMGVFTEEGQDLFNDLYDSYRDYIDLVFDLDGHTEYEKIITL